MLSDLTRLFIDYSVDIIPPFLLALLISAVLAEILSEELFEKILSSKNITYVLFVSITGALIPLCTCGMIPLAGKLQKRGASWLMVVSFLTAGNASSITALFMTLVLGLKITILRFVFSVLFGIIVAYIFVLFFKPKEAFNEMPLSLETTKSSSKIKQIIREFTELVISFGPWVLAAIFIATIMSLYFKPVDVVNIAGINNTASPFLLAVSGFPFYFCAGTDVPISKALLEKGASLGSVLSFMTAAPGVNLISLLVYQKWLGIKNSIIYLVISVLVAGVLGLGLNMVTLK